MLRKRRSFAPLVGPVLLDVLVACAPPPVQSATYQGAVGMGNSAAPATRSADPDPALTADLRYIQRAARPRSTQAPLIRYLCWPPWPRTDPDPEATEQPLLQVDLRLWDVIPKAQVPSEEAVKAAEPAVLRLLTEFTLPEEKGRVYYELATMFALSASGPGVDDAAGKYAREALLYPQDDVRKAELHDILGELKHQDYANEGRHQDSPARQEALCHYLNALTVVLANQRPLDPRDVPGAAHYVPDQWSGRRAGTEAASRWI